ncbi:hypothetical protein DL765_010405 [Monosporascus sp. GIB2]|nr:hypothetical protein DL765_010405 [Monosporascus sp. GIB2]
MTASSSRFIKSAVPDVRPRHLPVPAPHNRTDPDHHHDGANGTRPDAVEAVGFVGHETAGVESKAATPATTEGVAIKVPHNRTDPHCTDPNHHIDADGMANCPSSQRSAATAKLGLNGLGLAAALPRRQPLWRSCFWVEGGAMAGRR